MTETLYYVNISQYGGRHDNGTTKGVWHFALPDRDDDRIVQHCVVADRIHIGSLEEGEYLVGSVGILQPRPLGSGELEQMSCLNVATYEIHKGKKDFTVKYTTWGRPGSQVDVVGDGG